MIFAPQRGTKIVLDGFSQEVLQSYFEDLAQEINSVSSIFSTTSTITSDLNITASYGFYNVDASAGDVTLTLPSAKGQKCYTFRRANGAGGDVIILGAINGGSSMTLSSQYQTRTVANCAGNWGIVCGFG